MNKVVNLMYRTRDPERGIRKMKTIEVINVFNETVIVDIDRSKIMAYDNSRKIIAYCGPIMTGLNPGRFWTNFYLPGTVSDLETRARTCGYLLSFYANLVNFESKKNDPDGRIWSRIMEYVTAHESDFFVKNGNPRIHARKAGLKAYMEQC